MTCRRGDAVGEYRDRTALLAEFDSIFSAAVLAALRAADYEALFVRDNA